jgi:hypothetical protein
MFDRKPPKWVRKLPGGEVNRELLTQLAMASKNSLGTPRPIYFIVNYLKSRRDAETAAGYVQDAGWTPRIALHSNGPKKYLVEAMKDYYSITEKVLSDELFFVRVVDLHGVTYDGWYAKVV